MSVSRFVCLCFTLCFDDITLRVTRFQSDRVTVIREIYEIFNNSGTKAIVSDKFLSLDETLYRMRTGSAIKQRQSS